MKQFQGKRREWKTSSRTAEQCALEAVGNLRLLQLSPKRAVRSGVCGVWRTLTTVHTDTVHYNHESHKAVYILFCFNSLLLSSFYFPCDSSRKFNGFSLFSASQLLAFISGNKIFHFWHIYLMEIAKSICLEWNNSSRKGNSCRAELSRRNEQFASITTKRALFTNRSQEVSRINRNGVAEVSTILNAEKWKYMKHLKKTDSREKLQKENADTAAAHKNSVQRFKKPSL